MAAAPDPGPSTGLILGAMAGCGIGAITATELVSPTGNQLTLGTYLAGATVGGLAGVVVGGRVEHGLTSRD